ncbi:MAG: lanthionine synthetase LanC family protein [Thermoplasmatota archaeon]
MWTNFDSEANAIAERILSTAMHYKGRINWIARDAPDRVNMARPDPSATSLDPTLHSGLGGILLFLTRLNQTGTNPQLGESARGIIREIHAQFQAQAMMSLQRQANWYAQAPWGYFHGALGPLWACELAITEFSLDAQRSVNHALLDRSLRRRTTTGGADLMSGMAGAVPIVADLAKRNIPAAPAAFNHLVRQLTKASQPRDRGITWEKADPKWVDGLTGYSHGNAGMAHAYAAAHEYTKDERFRALAISATAYENSHYVAEQGNWRDLRTTPPHGRAVCEVAWCHGAPGIGLSRVALMHHAGSHTEWTTDAAVAQRTSGTILQSYLDSAGASYILCHGAAGVAECHRVLARQLDGDQRLSRQAAQQGIELYGSEAQRTNGRFSDWPLGPPGSSQPGLLKGLAGIGHFLLNAGHADLPSPLAVGTLTP